MVKWKKIKRRNQRENKKKERQKIQKDKNI